MITLLGPTASGKTALALEIAERLDLPVISVDSRQLYGRWIWAPPSPRRSNRRGCRTICWTCVHPTSRSAAGIPGGGNPVTVNWSSGVALLVGEWLVSQALLSGLQPPAVPPQPKLREQLTALGQGICHPLLQSADPKAAAKIAPADAVRTQRALEVLYASGQPMTADRHLRPGTAGTGPQSRQPARRIQQRTETPATDWWRRPGD